MTTDEDQEQSEKEKTSQKQRAETEQTIYKNSCQWKGAEHKGYLGPLLVTRKQHRGELVRIPCLVFQNLTDIFC